MNLVQVELAQGTSAFVGWVPEAMGALGLSLEVDGRQGRWKVTGVYATKPEGFPEEHAMGRMVLGVRS